MGILQPTHVPDIFW